MADFVVLASGNGSNFEALASAFSGDRHRLAALVCDRRHAPVFERAARFGVPAHYVPYYRRERTAAERDIMGILDETGPALIVLAGFMRVFTRSFVDRYPRKIVNIHPALLPAHPGAHGLTESYRAGDRRLGITIHYVDSGVDTGPIIHQEGFERLNGESLESVERRIHDLEHRVYPRVVRSLLEEAQ